MSSRRRSVELSSVPQIEVKWYHDWIKEHLPDQTGRVAIVTGANSGTGFWCAKALAGAGATVVMACRTPEKAEAAAEEILEDYPNAKVDASIRLDTSDLACVREFARTFNAKYDRLDILANNAGVMALPFSKTKDGFEIQWQTNHLGHFVLTNLLWRKMLDTPGESRVVNHSSSAHQLGKFSPDHMEKPLYGWKLTGWIAPIILPIMGMKPIENWLRYGVSKLSNVLFMKGLEKRIKEAGLESKVITIAVHPGYASTQLQQVAGEAGSMKDWQSHNESRAQSAADGSLPLLMGCVGKDVANGDYLGPTEGGTMRGPPGKDKIGGYGNDPDQVESLWKYSEKCAGEQFKI